MRATWRGAWRPWPGAAGDRFSLAWQGRSWPTSFRAWRWTEDAYEASAKRALFTAKFSAKNLNQLLTGWSLVRIPPEGQLDQEAAPPHLETVGILQGYRLYRLSADRARCPIATISLPPSCTRPAR